jgi:hypothetical protein
MSPTEPHEPFYQCSPATVDITITASSSTDASKAFPYGHVSSPSISTFSSVASYSDSADSTTSPTTAVTGFTTPRSGREDELPLQRHSPQQSYASSSMTTASSRPPRPSTSSASRTAAAAAVGRRLPPLPRKRGVSTDTTSTVASSILEFGETVTNGNAAYVDANKAPVVVAYREVNPLREHPVGMAY